MRIAIQIDKKEQKELKRIFSMYGRKENFKSITGFSRGALNNLLLKGAATEPVVKAVRNYVESI